MTENGPHTLTVALPSGLTHTSGHASQAAAYDALARICNGYWVPSQDASGMVGELTERQWEDEQDETGRYVTVGTWRVVPVDQD